MLKKLLLVISLVFLLNSCGILSTFEFAGDVSRTLTQDETEELNPTLKREKGSVFRHIGSIIYDDIWN
jgi:hypothetical protein